MVSMVNCHSQSQVPVEVLNDTGQLRKTMQEAVQSAGSPLDGSSLRLDRLYRDVERDSFRWLMATDVRARDLVEDAIDTLRALRCADALRQRGTVLKTSGGYEVFVDGGTASAIYALRMEDGRMYLLEVQDSVAAGEANLASSQLDRDGNLRVSFHRGGFGDPQTTSRAAYNVALVLSGLYGDTVVSFERPNSAGTLRASKEVVILLESASGNLEFTSLVIGELEGINPKAAARARCVPSMRHASEIEVARYVQAEELDWDLDTRLQALRRIAHSGHRTSDVSPVDSFQHVRPIQLKCGEVLIEAGAPSAFAYIPMGEGLRAHPLGGYATAPVQPWMPLGITGIIRGAPRNSTITAEQEVHLLMIPREVYLNAWHRTYSADELVKVLEQSGDGRAVASSPRSGA
jgi:hypothetical protein